MTYTPSLVSNIKAQGILVSLMQQAVVTTYIKLIPRLKAHELISILTSSRLKTTMKDSYLMAENSSVHVEYIIEIVSNIKTFIVCPIHRVDALLSDIGTCAFKRGISRKYIYSPWETR